MARFRAGTKLCFPGRNVADIDAIYARDRSPDVGLRSRKIMFSFRARLVRAAADQSFRLQPEMNLESMNSSSPIQPPSRARPDALTPPKAEPAPRDSPFISIRPAFS